MKIKVNIKLNVTENLEKLFYEKVSLISMKITSLL
jgi:hypothetical protein